MKIIEDIKEKFITGGQRPDYWEKLHRDNRRRKKRSKRVGRILKRFDKLNRV